MASEKEKNSNDQSCENLFQNFDFKMYKHPQGHVTVLHMNNYIIATSISSKLVSLHLCVA